MDGLYVLSMDIEEACRADLLAIAQTYAEATHVTLKTVSYKFYGRADFFERFRDDEISISLATQSEMLEKFDRKWPPGVKWPKVKFLKRPKLLD